MMSSTTVFEDVLRDFKAKLHPNDRTKFAGTTLKELQATITNLQNDQKASKSMQHMRRLEGFLEAMKTYTKVLDVFVNVNDMVAFIWGPVKYLLLVASNFSEAFNALLRAYERISENLPLLEQFQNTFGEDIRMQKALEAIFRDIFEFHLDALKYFRKRVLKQVFHATWDNFNTKFDALLSNMSRHKGLVETQASLIEFEKAERTRARDLRAIADAQRSETLRRKIYLQTWLSAANVESEHLRLTDARKWNNNTGNWLFASRKLQTWIDPQAVTSPLLWINGIPGAGKSVLASALIDKLKNSSQRQVLYFYCRHGDSQRDTFVGLVRSLLQQLIQHDEEMHVVHLYEEAVKSGEVHLRRQNLAEHLLDVRLKEAAEAFIVVDGLDECPDAEQKHIVSWLRKFINDSAGSTLPFRCVFFGQNDACGGALLSKEPTLAVRGSDQQAEIASYCTFRSQEVQLNFELSDAETAALALKTAAGADGMFLFARLVMFNLESQTNRAAVYAEMGDNFPNGLDAAYARILDRIFGKDAPKPHQLDAKQILAWLVCAIRPLKWREIQAALSIDVQDETVDVDLHRRILSAKQLCSSLIEESSNGDIVLVHSTARFYLQEEQHQHRIITADEHLKLSTLCLDYLSLPLFLDNEESIIDDHVLKGSYGFLEYALVYWMIHLERAFTESVTQVIGSLLLEFEQTLDTFFRLTWNSPSENLRPTKAMIELVNNLQDKDETLRPRLLETLACMHKLKSFNIQDPEESATTKIILILPIVRGRIEKLSRQSEHLSKLHRFYGSGLHRCSRLYCTEFYEGFRYAQDRDTHTAKHDRPFFCPHSGCPHATLGCVTQQDLDKHITDYHKAPATEDDFPDLFQTSRNSKRGQKRPGEHICQTCQMGFPKPSNLRAHVLSHTNYRPHTCGICSKGFAREVDLTRHQNVHRDRKKLTCRGADCGKTFGRQDALLRHWKSQAGQRCPFTFPESTAEEPALSVEKRIQEELALQLQAVQSDVTAVEQLNHSPLTHSGNEGSDDLLTEQFGVASSGSPPAEGTIIPPIRQQWQSTDSRSTTLDGTSQWQVEHSASGLTYVRAQRTP